MNSTFRALYSEEGGGELSPIVHGTGVSVGHMASLRALLWVINYVTLLGVETIVTRSVIVTSVTNGEWRGGFKVP